VIYTNTFPGDFFAQRKGAGTYTFNNGKWAR